MAIDQFQVGEGYLALAYGLHYVAGHLAEHSVKFVGNDKQVSIKTLLGRGEWNAIKELTYEGSIIDPSNYAFHPGVQSSGYADPLQGQDPRFPSSLLHNNVAYYSATLPVGMADDDRPDKMRVIAECLKVWTYDDSGNHDFYGYSTNPANVFVDLVRRNCAKLGLPFNDFVDWEDYYNAYLYYANTLVEPDQTRQPKNLSVSSATGGSLPAGTYAVSVVARDSTGQSSRTIEISVAIDGTTKTAISGALDAVTDATGYRWWVKSGTTYYYTDTASPSLSLTTLGTVGTPLNEPSGAFSVSKPRFESHRAFTDPNMRLNDALNAVMFDACSDFTKDGKRWRILTPQGRSSVHTLTVSNTLPDSFNAWRVERVDRVNRVTGTFRNLDDPDFKEVALPPSADRSESQAKVGTNEESVNLGSMRLEQAARVLNWRIRNQHDLNGRMVIDAFGDSAEVLPGDVVTAVDPYIGWSSGKDFLIAAIEDADSDSADTRHFECVEYNDSAYSDTDKAPLVLTNPASAPKRFSAPPAVVSVTLEQQNETRADGSLSMNVAGVIQFAAHVTRQLGRVYHKKPGGDYEYIQSIEPETTTNVSGFRVYGVTPGTHYIKVVSASVLGVPQSAPVVEYSVEVEYPQEAAPIFGGVAAFDPVNGHMQFEWNGTPITSAEGMERYDVEIYQFSPEVLKRSIQVVPHRMKDVSEFVFWNVAAPVNLGDGSLESTTIDTFQVFGKFAAATDNGLFFEVTVPASGCLPEFISLYPQDAGSGGTLNSQSFFWKRTNLTAPFTYAPEGLTEFNFTASAGDRLNIWVRPDRTVEYRHSAAGSNAAPLYVSGRSLNASSKYKPVAIETQSFIGIKGLRRARWARSESEFIYTAEMQRADFSLTPEDPLPGEFIVKVYQRSRYGGSGRSIAASTSLFRP